ncbi:sensor histidine kinase [Roseibium sp.]|uniref:sensor histidine kinase n=1 Tax=Roseibium sp. TaxID=1936156 RepID=UPI003B505762
MKSAEPRRYSLFIVMVFGVSSFLILLVIVYTVSAIIILIFDHSQFIEQEMRSEAIRYEKLLELDPNAEPSSSLGYEMVYSYNALPARVRGEFSDKIVHENQLYHSYTENDDVWLMKLSLKDGRALFVSLVDPDDELVEQLGFGLVEKMLLLVTVVLVAIVCAVLCFTYSILRQLRSLEYYITNMSLSDLSNIRPLLRFKEFDAIAEKFEQSTKRSAEFVNRETEFLSFSSHELRTPLAIVAGNIDLLKLKLGDCAPEPLARLERACCSMQLAVETLLWLGRESSRKSDAPDTACHSVIRASVDTWQSMFGKQTPEVILRIEDWNTSSNGGSFGLVVDNLIRNSFQHGENDIIEVIFESARLIIRNKVSSAEVGKKGIGIMMCERICARNGWLFKVQVSGDTFTANVQI